MNEYQKLMKKIQAPKALQQKVLTAAGEGAGGAVRRNGRTFVRAAVCTVCALVLVLGTWTLRRDKTLEGNGEEALNYSFGLMAQAAENTVNGGIAILWENACGSFRIAGEGVHEIMLTTDLGMLLRNGEVVGSTLTDPFDPEIMYGLTTESGGAEVLDGAVLTVMATYADGTFESRSYPLSTELLRTFVNADGSEVMVPTLLGDDIGTVKALYTFGAESHWLMWPVAKSNTVRLSMPYGNRDAVGGETLFHSGIDIPGAAGIEITAAAGGIVAEAAFDASRGNYLVLDHGNGMTTLYAHCQKLLVEKGRQVAAGECVALMGSTGMSTGPHLHFEVRRGGTPENPVAYFDNMVRDTLRAE